MDKNTLWGLLLIAAVMFGFMYLNKPDAGQAAPEATENTRTAASEQQPTVTDTIGSAELGRLAGVVKSLGSADGNGTYTLETERVRLQADSAGRVSGTVKARGGEVALAALTVNDGSVRPELHSAAIEAVRRTMADAEKYKSFARHLGGAGTTSTLENDVMKVTFASRGGMIERVELKNYTTETTTPPTNVVLESGADAGYSFVLTTTDQRFDTREFNFDAEQLNDTTMLMKLDMGHGAMWGIRYTLRPGQYTVRTEIVQQNIGDILPPSMSTVGFKWHTRLARNEKGRMFEERNSAVMYKATGDTPEELKSNGDDSEEPKGRVKWVAFKNQFFSSVVIADASFAATRLQSVEIKDDKYLKDMSMQAEVPYTTADGTGAAFTMLFGPNDYPMLSGLDDELGSDEDLELTRLVPLGWGIFRWINKYLIIPVFSILGEWISNYGIIILLLTIFIKIILFPFTYKSYMSQAKMRVLAPEINEINEKYPGQENAMRRQQETMSLYSRAGASPFSGCLPMLLQMPILIAMFSFFPSAIELRGQSFLWAHDLSAPDFICKLPFSIPFYGDHVSLFCLLMTVVNIIYTRINMQSQPGGNSMPGMKWMMYLMPVMFLFFFNDYASGLSYYYFLSLLITIVQTYVFRKVINEDKVRATLLANAKKPRKKSGFMARLEEAQRQQQAMMREQAKQQARRRK